MKKILTAFLFVIMLCTISSADIIYTTTDGGLGLIKISGAKSSDLEGIKYNSSKNNPITESYWDGDKSLIILVYSDDTSSDKALRFSNSDLSRPIDEEAKTLTGIHGVEKILSTGSGNGIIFVAEDLIQEFSTNNFSVKRAYSDDLEEINDAVILGEGIYTLVNNNILMHFDGQLKKNTTDFASWDVHENSTSLASLSNTVAIANDNGLQILKNYKNEEPQTNYLDSTNAPVKSICADNSSGFYYVCEDNTLHHFDGSGNQIDSELNAPSKLVRDKNHNVLAVMTSDSIMLYDMADDKLVNEYDKTQLGGTPYYIAMSTSSGTDSDNGGTSSCNLTGLGLVLISCVFLRRKSNS